MRRNTETMAFLSIIAFSLLKIIMKMKAELKAWYHSVVDVNIIDSHKDRAGLGFSIFTWTIILVVLYGG